MSAEKEDLLKDAKPVHQTRSFSLLRTIFSLLLFIAVDYWIFKSWAAVFLLVTIIFLHESGHFIAMKLFGYKGINMTFVPFMGAFVSGEATHFSKYKKIIMLLAGPLPGIIIGMLLLFLYQQQNQEQYYIAALAFMLLNIFNLLPVSPLDGGQFIETLFFSGNLLIQIIFLGLSLLIALYALYALRSWILLVVAWFIFIRMGSTLLTYRVRKILDEKNISYDCSYDDLPDDQYAQIRDVLVTQSRLLRRRFVPGEYSPAESELVSYIERILVPSYDHHLSSQQKIIFLIIYLLAFILPFLQWAFLKKLL